MKFSPNRYKLAASKYRPIRTRVLFVAEAPPSDADRYFYFETVRRHDSLWIELMKELFPGKKWRQPERERKQKHDWLSKFQTNGYQLIDALKEPTNCTSAARVTNIKARSRKLISEVKRINPECIVLIKVTVYDALFASLRVPGSPLWIAVFRFRAPGNKGNFIASFRANACGNCLVRTRLFSIAQLPNYTITQSFLCLSLRSRWRG